MLVIKEPVLSGTGSEWPTALLEFHRQMSGALAERPIARDGDVYVN